MGLLSTPAVPLMSTGSYSSTVLTTTTDNARTTREHVKRLLGLLLGPKSLPLTQRCWEGEGLRRYAICVAPDCLQYMFRDWARYHATRTSGRRCAHHLLAITSLPARKGVEISEGSAPDNDAAPSVAPLYHFLSPRPIASLEQCSDSVLVHSQSGEQAKLVAKAFVARRRRLYNSGR